MNATVTPAERMRSYLCMSHFLCFVGHTAHVDRREVAGITELRTFYRQHDVARVLLLQLLARHLVGIASTVEALAAVHVVLALATAVERDEVLTEVELAFRKEIFLLGCRVLALFTCWHVQLPRALTFWYADQYIVRIYPCIRKYLSYLPWRLVLEKRMVCPVLLLGNY